MMPSRRALDQRLLEQLDPAETATLLGHVKRLTGRVGAMLAVENEEG
jgi:hypothetical protein